MSAPASRQSSNDRLSFSQAGSTQQGVLALVANVRGSHTQYAPEPRVLAGGAEMTVQERCDLGTPLWLFGHGRQELELEHEPWHLQSDSTLEDIPGHLIVVPANLTSVGRDDVDDRQREIHLGKDLSRSDCQTAATRDRPGGLSENEILRIKKSQGGIELRHRWILLLTPRQTSRASLQGRNSARSMHRGRCADGLPWKAP